MYSSSVEKLIKLFAKFPTVGPRTAARFVFYLIKTPSEKTKELIAAIENLKKEIKICPSCFKSFEAANTLCEICSNKSRNKNLLCVVEKEMDLAAIEKTNQFKGTYFILGGTINGNDEMKAVIEKQIQTLLLKIQKEAVSEVILALNPTPEGQQTALLVKRRLSPDLRITQLGVGLPLGGELEYADEETITSAIDNRK